MGKLPRQSSELTTDWLSEVLGGRVDSFTLDDIGTGAGIFGEIMRVHVTGEAGLPTTLIAKFPTTDPNNRPVGDALGIYEREVQFFRTIAPTTPLRVPKAYFADLDAADGAYTLLIEDLGRYDMGDQVAGVSVARAERIIDGLVVLHATWWEKPELFAQTWLPTSADPQYLAILPGVWSAGHEALKRDWAEVLGTEVMSVVDRLAPQWEGFLRRTNERPNTLLHTDTRLDNFFFDGDDPIFIDWQLMVRGRGPADVAYLLGNSMEPELQTAHWESILRRYHDGLVAKGVKDYTWEQCLRAYRESVLYYTVGAMSLLGTFDPGNDRGRAMVDAYVRRSFHQLIDSGAASLL
jgi:hypothetical protein